jgi:menaquinone-dependent protoporphyrinogen IX oxidase
MCIKVLVAYASKYGAMKEIAEKIGLVLKDAGFVVQQNLKKNLNA